VYDIYDNEVSYTFLDRVFGPRISVDDLEMLECRALLEGWHEWYYLILQMKRKKKRRWLLAYLRDEIIAITVSRIYDPTLDGAYDEAYDDDDPWEGMG
jgi:hypothetical protein